MFYHSRIHRQAAFPGDRRAVDRPVAAVCAAAFAVVTAILLPLAPAGAQPQINLSSVANKSAGGAKTLCDGTKCFVAKGHTLLAHLTGAGIAQAGFITDNSGSLASTLTGYKMAPNIIEVQVAATSNGSRGEKEVKVQYKVGSTVYTEWPFRVAITNNGTITNATFPSPTDFFTEATITVNGSDLSNVKYFVPNDVQPKPTITTVSNTGTTLTMKATYASLQSAPQLRVVLCDEQVTGFGCPLAWGTVSGTLKGPPAIKLVAVGGTPKVGSDMAMEFQLTTAARSGGEQVWWRISSPTNFTQASSSCPYNPSALRNTFTIPRGNTSHTCSLRVASAAGMGPVTRTLEVWVVNPDKSDAPYYYKRDITISSM